MGVEDLKAQWPRPRVGERVRLHERDQVADVAAVRGATIVLRSMKEIQALRFGPEQAAAYGPHWMKIYYQADVYVRGKLRVVEPRDVAEVLPPL
jgi:hypothetical protein